MLKGDSNTQIALMNIHERFLFSFFSRFFRYFIFTAPFFSLLCRSQSVKLEYLHQKLQAHLCARERAKEQVQLNAVHKGMHV